MVLAGYVLLFLFLDWVSFIRPLHGLDITLWSPQSALAVALLLLHRRLWWLVFGGHLVAEVLVRGVPDDVAVAALAAAAQTGCYLAMAVTLRDRLGGGIRLASARDVILLQAVIAVGALASAVAYVGVFSLSGALPTDVPWQSIGRFWVGDAVGMAVMLPLLLVVLDPERRESLLQTVRRGSWRLSAVVVFALLAVLASGGEERLGHAYLLLLPVIWAAMRDGLAGGVLASAFAQVGVIVAMQAGAHSDVVVLEMQLRMATISMTGLLLGVTVDERSRVDAELRRSLRMAAAGQMSAALAHEMSQPLTALAAYAQACERLAADPEPVTPERRAMLQDVTRRIALDARRSSDVVKRLRDFFQSGATQLKACNLAELIHGEVWAQQRRADAERIRLRVEVVDGLPTVLADEVQVAVVVRNLVSNALDAVGSGSPRGGEVLVRARAEPRELLVEVIDSGSGLTAAQTQSVFEPGVTDKVGGMGVGLSICRAIIEAHDGRLWALPGPGGRFFFTLPLGQDDAPTGVA